MKKIIGIAVLITAMATAAFAQTGEITDYMFTTPADSYMEPQWYPGVGLEKFYAQAGFRNDEADLGFAAKTGGLYLGVSYNGHIFRQINIGYTESEVTSFNGSPKTVKQYVVTPNLTGPDGPSHDIGILIGVADMGFLLGFNSTYQLFEVREDTLIGGNEYKSYKAEYGALTPMFKWGMAKDLTANGIRPAISVSLGFNTDSIQSERYYSSGASYPTYNIITGSSGYGTDNYTDLEIAFNLGGYTLLSKDNGFSLSVDFDYLLRSTIYGDNQNSRGTGATVYTFKEQGRFNGATDFDTDIKDARHTIAPVLQVLWDSEKIGLGARLHLPVVIDSEEYTNNDITYAATTYTLDKNGTSKKTSVLFAPRLRLGGQYRLVPNKFNINMGASIGLSTASQSDAENTPNGGKTTKTVTPGTSGTSAAFSIGATLFLTDNVSVDANTGVSNVRTFNFFTNTVGNIFTFSRLLLMIKF